MAADHITLVGLTLSGAHGGAVHVREGVEGTAFVGCTFDGNYLADPADADPDADPDRGGHWRDRQRQRQRQRQMRRSRRELGPAGAGAWLDEDDSWMLPEARSRGFAPPQPEDRAGGGAAVGGGAALSLSGGNGATLVAASRFAHNVAPYGGAVAADRSELTVYDCFFSSNFATAGDGGGIRMGGESNLENILHLTKTDWMFNSIADDDSYSAMGWTDHGGDRGGGVGDRRHGPIVYSEGLVCDAGSNFACKNGIRLPGATDDPTDWSNLAFGTECNGPSYFGTFCHDFADVCEASKGPPPRTEEEAKDGLEVEIQEIINNALGGPAHMPASIPSGWLGADHIGRTPTASPDSNIPFLSPVPEGPPACGGSMSSGAREKGLLRTLGTVSRFDHLIPSNPPTPQYRAFRWLVDYDGMQLCPGLDAIQFILQRYILAVLYFSSGGDLWTRCSNGTAGSSCPQGGRFLGSNSECLWFGISCTSTGRVFSIDFELNNLVGTIPGEIGYLTGLTQLMLEDGGLFGTIPSTIGQLKNLQVLDLDYNHLEGKIPREISGATGLLMVDLNDNALEGGIENLASLGSLERLWLHSNSFEGLVPAQLGNLEYLSKLISVPSLLVRSHLPLQVCSPPSFVPFFLHY